MVLLPWGAALAQIPVPLILPDPNPDVGLWYGQRVAISGDYAFVSEPFSLNESGDERVHVFNRWVGGSNSWGLTQSLSAPDGDGLGFGTGLYAWEDRLAVYRSPHSTSYLGATICKARTVFLFRLNDSGQWVPDGVIGGELLNSGPCPSNVEGYTGQTMDAEGDVLLLSTESTGWFGEVYQRDPFGNWGLMHTRPLYFPFACASGDTMVYYQGPQSIGFSTIHGEELPSLFITALSGGSTCCRNLDVSDGLMAIGQVNGEFGDYSMGRVLFRNTTYPDYPASDTISYEGSSAFANGIRFTGNTLVVREGGWFNTPIRFFVYQRNIIASENWSLVHVIPFVESFPEGFHLPEFDASNDGLMITSVRLPVGTGFYDTYEVSIWDLSLPVGVSEDHSIPANFDLQRSGERIYLCEVEGTLHSGSKVYISDIAGRLLVTSNITHACSSGVDLAHLASGIYVVELRSNDSRSSIKLQW